MPTGVHLVVSPPPSVALQALIHGLNRHYYSIAINYRKTALEENMLLNLQASPETVLGSGRGGGEKEQVLLVEGGHFLGILTAQPCHGGSGVNGMPSLGVWNPGSGQDLLP